jgi:hypothetical protein
MEPLWSKSNLGSRNGSNRVVAVKTLKRNSAGKKQAVSPIKKERVPEMPAVGFNLPPIDVQHMQVMVVGDSSLICHNWSQKAKEMMLNKQMKKAEEKKEPKNPEQDFYDSLYHLANGRYGFPAVAFKSAAVDACRYLDFKMTEARGAFHVEGKLVEIFGTPTPREDMVKLGGLTADIRFRGEFLEWHATLNVRYNRAAMSAEQIVHLFNVGGFGVGVGEWRPEKNGSNGMFHVATEADRKELRL